jgi:UDP-3-O-[3-hydroxymyristoyl] glucosamine N-acyltransferase
MKKITLKEIANLIPDSIIKNTTNPDSIEIINVKNLSMADQQSISLVTGKAFLKECNKSAAGAIITTEDLANSIEKPCLIVTHPEIAMGFVLEYFFPERRSNGIISNTSFIHPSAKIGQNVSIGHFVSVGENSIIEKDSIIDDGVKIGKNVIIGENARIGMNVVFHDDTVVGKNFKVFGNSTFGGDGFKFVTVKGIHHKIPQVGKVIIGDNVEIGSNCTIDRGGLEDTIIGSGCKFDNMVHVGHNCKIGNHVIIAGQSGVAGSTVIEDGVIIGGGCCVSDHLHVPTGTIIAGGTGMRTSPKEPGIYIGWDWGMTFAEFQKARVNIKHLVTFNKFISRIKELEKKLGIEES